MKLIIQILIKMKLLYTFREKSMWKLRPFVILYLFTIVKLCNMHDRLKEYFILFF